MPKNNHFTLLNKPIKQQAKLIISFSGLNFTSVAVAALTQIAQQATDDTD